MRQELSVKEATSGLEVLDNIAEAILDDTGKAGDAFSGPILLLPKPARMSESNWGPRSSTLHLLLAREPEVDAVRAEESAQDSAQGQAQVAVQEEEEDGSVSEEDDSEEDKPPPPKKPKPSRSSSDSSGDGTTTL
ncbi:hypothetical protein PF004_g27348 [Phytophthora fragariae]|uniref:Uncharacterized protein n=1 Tax=Phytophthora fragariae TaxID=53985 RepID=A0A6G0MKT7_9STRA|nr:hypothetical protein PF004_g27348 [Phytophthora fragariae]